MPTCYHEMVWKYSVTHKTVHVGVRARPDKPGEKAIVKLQSCVRGKSTRTKKVKILAPLAKATLKSTIGIRASRNIKDYLAGKKRKSRTSKKGKNLNQVFSAKKY